VVAPVIGQQRSSVNVLCSQPSSVAAVLNPSPGLSTATSTYDATGVPHGANAAMLLPGSQPMIAVGAVASDVPSLMSQLANLQASLMATALYGSVPSGLHGSALSISNTAAQSDSSAVHGAFTSQTSNHDERPHNI